MEMYVFTVVIDYYFFFQTACPDVYRGIWGGNKCRDSPVQVNNLYLM